MALLSLSLAIPPDDAVPPKDAESAPLLVRDPPDIPNSFAMSLSNSEPPEEMPSPSDEGSHEVVVVAVGVDTTSPRDAGRGVVGIHGGGESGVVGKKLPAPSYS